MSKTTNSDDLYWKKNIQCLVLLLAIWFSVSFGCGILWVDWLDQFRIPGTGFKLGFWMSQQGSIYCFILIILYYVIYMNRLENKFKDQKNNNKK